MIGIPRNFFKNEKTNIICPNKQNITNTGTQACKWQVKKLPENFFGPKVAEYCVVGVIRTKY